MKLLRDLLYLPVYIVLRFLTQPASKSFYRIQFALFDPISNFDHFILYRIKRNVRYSHTTYVNINDLSLGHKVEHDEYFEVRCNRARFSCRALRSMSKSFLRTILPSDCSISVYGNKVLNGNGRIEVLKQSGFTGDVQVDVFIDK